MTYIDKLWEGREYEEMGEESAMWPLSTKHTNTAFDSVYCMCVKASVTHYADIRTPPFPSPSTHKGITLVRIIRFPCLYVWPSMLPLVAAALPSSESCPE